MKLAIGCDHAGPELKSEVLEYLDSIGVEYVDLGVQKGEKCDYPDKAKEVCEKVTSGECDMAVLICGTGIGMSMAANKVKGARAALCHDPYSAKMTRLHNDANILCMGGLVIGNNLALEITEVFLNTDFSGEERHQRRIDLIED